MTGGIFYMVFDLGMAALLFLLGVSFYRSQGKAGKWIAGYNAHRDAAMYDEEKMCRDYGKRMMSWATCFAGGFVIDLFWPGIGCILAWAAYAVLLVWHIVDSRKNFETRYARRPPS